MKYRKNLCAGGKGLDFILNILDTKYEYEFGHTLPKHKLFLKGFD